MLKQLWLWLAASVLWGHTLACPKECYCPTEAIANCMSNELSDLPQNLSDDVRALDLSYNHFMAMPSNISAFSKLESLSLKHNRINSMRSLEGLRDLKELDLSQNAFSRWSDIHPKIFSDLESLQCLDLSQNTMRTFPNINSDSLEILDLTDTAITSVRFDTNASLPRLKSLNLSKNKMPVFSANFKSDSLMFLNLTDCNIQSFYAHVFANLPTLMSLTLTQNFELKSLTGVSSSMQTLDISKCNFEKLPGIECTNLNYIDVSGNHLRRVDAFSFANMPNVVKVQLSHNSIEEVHRDAFADLVAVNEIDLSYNMIPALSPETFAPNIHLKILNLSHNYLTRLAPFRSRSLIHLDVSKCEISELTLNNLKDLTSLAHLNLSGNVISHVPNYFQSKRLKVLDLSYCKISNLKNETFKNMDNLLSLNLMGNRLVEIKHNHLQSVRNVWLGDNSWRCECEKRDFKDLYQHLTNISSDVYSLICHSPEIVEGTHWYTACEEVWFAGSLASGRKAWLYSLVFVLVFCIGFCVMVSMNRNRRKKQRATEELERQREEALLVLRRMRAAEAEIVVATTSSNAPDPREEENPPTYQEAISMTNLAGSSASLNNSSKQSEGSSKPRKLRRKRKRSAQKPANETTRVSDEEPSRSSVFVESDL